MKIFKTAGRALILAILVLCLGLATAYADTENEGTETDVTSSEANVFKITYVLNGGANDPGNPAEYGSGDSITLLPASRQGYAFKGWYKTSKFKTSVKAILPSYSGDRTLYAKWTANTYKVVFDKNGASSGKMSSKKLTYDKVFSLPANAFKRKGYTFTGWNTEPDGSGASYRNKEKVKNLTSGQGDEVRLYAQWSKDTYTISYRNVSSEELEAAGNPSSYQVDSPAIALNLPLREGYTAKWYTTSRFRTAVSAIKTGSTGNRTLYAKWTANKYSVVFNGNGATSGKVKTQKFTFSKSAALTKNAFKRNGYTFVCWNTEPDGSGVSYSNKQKVMNLVSENGGTVTLYAQWKINTYKITYKLNGGTNDPDNPSAYTVLDEGLTFGEPVREGYTFCGWYKDSKLKTKMPSIKAGTTGDKTLYAKWTANKFMFVFDGNGATGGSMKNQTVTCGKACTLAGNAFKKSDSTFICWNTEPDGTGASIADKTYIKDLFLDDGSVVVLYAQWGRRSDAYDIYGRKLDEESRLAVKAAGDYLRQMPYFKDYLDEEAVEHLFFESAFVSYWWDCDKSGLDDSYYVRLTAADTTVETIWNGLVAVDAATGECAVMDLQAGFDNEDIGLFIEENVPIRFKMLKDCFIYSEPAADESVLTENYVQAGSILYPGLTVYEISGSRRTYWLLIEDCGWLMCPAGSVKLDY